MSNYISEMNEQEPLPDDHEPDECPLMCKVHSSNENSMEANDVGR